MIQAILMPLAALLASAGPSTHEEKSIFLESYEGHGPEVQRYELEGLLPPGGANFRLRVTFPGERPLIEFSRGDSTVRVSLAGERFASVPLNRVVIATRSRSPEDDAVIVSIPFGEPLEDCFVNGDEVYRQIEILIDGNRLERIDELGFSACNASHSTPQMSVEQGMVVIR